MKRLLLRIVASIFVVCFIVAGYAEVFANIVLSHDPSFLWVFLLLMLIGGAVLATGLALLLIWGNTIRKVLR